MKEALARQRATNMYIFGNSDGQPYTISAWNTHLRRLIYARKKAEKEGIEFARFTLKDMRPAAVTDQVDDGEGRSRTLPDTAVIAWWSGCTTGGKENGAGG